MRVAKKDSMLPSVAGAMEDETITVPAAARLLGIEAHTLYRLIVAGELGSVQTYERRVNGRSRQRRKFTLTRRELDAFIERSRVKPGELRHLAVAPQEESPDRERGGPRE